MLVNVHILSSYLYILFFLLLYIYYVPSVVIQAAKDPLVRIPTSEWIFTH